MGCESDGGEQTGSKQDREGGSWLETGRETVRNEKRNGIETRDETRDETGSEKIRETRHGRDERNTSARRDDPQTGGAKRGKGSNAVRLGMRRDGVAVGLDTRARSNGRR